MKMYKPCLNAQTYIIIIGILFGNGLFSCAGKKEGNKTETNTTATEKESANTPPTGSASPVVKDTAFAKIPDIPTVQHEAPASMQNPNEGSPPKSTESSARYFEAAATFIPLQSELIWWDAAPQDFEKQKRPLWQNMLKSYPLDENGNELYTSLVYELVGGPIHKYHLNDTKKIFYNACALRISRALNYSNIKIPYVSDFSFKGGDNRNYIVSSPKMYNFLLSTFGKGDIMLDGREVEITEEMIKSVLQSKKGIFGFQVNDTKRFGAYGHIGLYNQTECVGGHCHFKAHEYGGIRKFAFWELK